MFKVAFTQLLSHIQDQNTWAAALLLPHVGQVIEFSVSVLSQRFTVLENGQLVASGETAEPDATVKLMPTTLLRLLAKDEAAKSQITITGDSALASTVAKMFANMRWDATDDLSKVIGDVPAEEISRFSKAAASSAVETSKNAASMVSEYLQEETMVIVKPRHIETFNDSVDTLRGDTARLEKRIEKLNKKIQQSLAVNTVPLDSTKAS
jgi:ubiquinone biosynthesis protein UbiJ